MRNESENLSFRIFFKSLSVGLNLMRTYLSQNVGVCNNGIAFVIPSIQDVVIDQFENEFFEIPKTGGGGFMKKLQ